MRISGARNPEPKLDHILNVIGLTPRAPLVTFIGNNRNGFLNVYSYSHKFV